MARPLRIGKIHMHRIDYVIWTKQQSLYSTAPLRRILRPADDDRANPQMGGVWG